MDYVNDSDGNPLENITVVVAGANYTTGSNGFYNISVDVLEGTEYFHCIWRTDMMNTLQISQLILQITLLIKISQCTFTLLAQVILFLLLFGDM